MIMQQHVHALRASAGKVAWEDVAVCIACSCAAQIGPNMPPAIDDEQQTAGRHNKKFSIAGKQLLDTHPVTTRLSVQLLCRAAAAAQLQLLLYAMLLLPC
jgi:hypothetical protein